MVQVAVKLAMMLCVHWAYGLATLIIMLLFYVYIGQAAPGGPPGIATEFVFLLWIKNKFLACIGYSVLLSAERKKQTRNKLEKLAARMLLHDSGLRLYIRSVKFTQEDSGKKRSI